MIKKTSNIILRINEQDHKTIKIKSAIYGKNKSNFIREASLSYIKKDKSEFKKLLELYKKDSDCQEDIIEMLFNYYRNNGFPYYVLSDEEKNKKMLALFKTPSPLLENDLLQSNHVGTTLASSFHKHLLEMEYYNSSNMSPMNAFIDDEKFRDCIKRTLDLDIIPDHVGMRKILRTRNGVRSVTNFKPAIAKFIYDTYAPENGRVIDPCAGFSGRLCGAIASNKNLSYTGIDPDERTIKGNVECTSSFKKDYKFNTGFYIDCAEDVMPKLRGNYYDLVFTSPPYFDVEKYSDDKTQSMIKFSQYQEWLDGFLYKIVEESHRVLKNGFYFAINIKNYNNHKIADDFLNYAKKIGFTLEKTYRMKLANNEFHRKIGQVNYHTEPIFILRKINSSDIHNSQI